MATRQFMSHKETAAYLHIESQTLANWRYLGKGPRFYKLGQLVKYDLRDVEAWLEQHANEPAPAA